MDIWIPTLQRAAGVAALLNQIPPKLQLRTFLMVGHEDPQLEEYKRRYHKVNGVTVWVTEAKGIAHTRQAIAATSMHLTTLMLDDDIKFFRRTTPDDVRLIEPDDDSMTSMFMQVQYLLESSYSAVGISAREGNNRLPQPFAENTRIIRALGFRNKDFLECEHGRVEVMEDFDVLLQLLRKGKPNANISLWAQDQRMTNAPGGCSTYRTHEVHDRSARKLAELHPEYVRLRQKANKTGGEFGIRTEVTISWKKAFESGAAK